MEKKLQYNIYQPFGPTILKVKMPQEFINKLNVQADEILNDEKLSKEKDYSPHLAGNVKKEITMDYNKIEGFSQFLGTVAYAYVKCVLPKGLSGETKVSFNVWVVSQYAGDFNPMHIHSSNLSGVAFLKMPPKFEEEYKREDHHPTVGCLEFIGSMANHFTRHNYIMKPEVGDFYIFPSWLTHQVYPFRSEGERRSMSFNANFSLTGSVKGVNT